MSKTASVLSISALFLLVICDDIDGAIVATVGIEIEVSDNVTFKNCICLIWPYYVHIVLYCRDEHISCPSNAICQLCASMAGLHKSHFPYPVFINFIAFYTLNTNINKF